MIDATGYATQKPAQAASRGNGQAAASWVFPAVVGSFRYRVHAGRALSRYYGITAVTRPKIEAVAVHLDFPEYTALKAQTSEDRPSLIEAVAGTSVSLKVTANLPVARPQLSIAGNRLAAPAFQADGPGGAAYTWTFPIDPAAVGQATLVLEDEARHRLRAAAVRGPRDPRRPAQGGHHRALASQVTLKPQARLALKYKSEDDFGIGKIELLVKRDAEEPTVVELPLPKNAVPPLLACRGQTELNLAESGLGAARQLTVQIRVSDTLPASMKGPNHGLSNVLVIEIDHQAEAALAEAEAARQAAEAARAEAEKLKDLAQREEQLAEQAAATPADEAQDEKWRQEQEKLAAELAEAVKKDPDALCAELKGDQQRANDLAKEAKDLADQQRALQKEAGDKATPDEKSKQEGIQEKSESLKGEAQDMAAKADVHGRGQAHWRRGPQRCRAGRRCRAPRRRGRSGHEEGRHAGRRRGPAADGQEPRPRGGSVAEIRRRPGPKGRRPGKTRHAGNCGSRPVRSRGLWIAPRKLRMPATTSRRPTRPTRPQEPWPKRPKAAAQAGRNGRRASPAQGQSAGRAGS